MHIYARTHDLYRLQKSLSHKHIQSISIITGLILPSVFSGMRDQSHLLSTVPQGFNMQEVAR